MVDILLAVYNGEKYISQQIDSILSQSCSDWNLIIQDDHSSDGTIGLVQNYAERYPEKIRFFINQNNSGSPQKNFFSMLGRSKAPYVMTCDHDDVWLPDKVELTLRKMLETEHAAPGRPVLVHTDLKVVDENLNILSESMFESQCLDSQRDKLNHLLVQNIVTGCTMMVNRPLLQMVSVLPKRAIMHDWWFALIAAAFGTIGFVEQATILYRQHVANQVGAKDVKSLGFVAKRVTQREEIKKVLQDTYLQAEDFLIEFGDQLPLGLRELVNRYAQLPNQTKGKRLATLFTQDFFKHGLTRRVGQLFFI